MFDCPADEVRCHGDERSGSTAADGVAFISSHAYVGKLLCKRSLRQNVLSRPVLSCHVPLGTKNHIVINATTLNHIVEYRFGKNLLPTPTNNNTTTTTVTMSSPFLSERLSIFLMRKAVLLLRGDVERPL